MCGVVSSVLGCMHLWLLLHDSVQNKSSKRALRSFLHDLSMCHVDIIE